MAVSWIPNVLMRMLTFKLASDSCKINNTVFKYVLRGFFVGLRQECSGSTMLNSCWTSAVSLTYIVVLILKTRISYLLDRCCPLSIFAMTFFEWSPPCSHRPHLLYQLGQSVLWTSEAAQKLSALTNYVIPILLIWLMRCFSSVRQMLQLQTGTERNLNLWKLNYCLQEMFCPTYSQMLRGSHPVLPSWTR